MAYNYSLFDLIGPIMVGPSSSHTAGAARLARLARSIFGKTPSVCNIKLYGSFAETYQGHGSHLAIAAGLMGWLHDDERISTSLKAMEQEGLNYSFLPQINSNDYHPNTLSFTMTNQEQSHTNYVLGHSLGGGVVEVSEIDGFRVSLRGAQHSLLIFHLDRPGVITRVTRALADDEINISSMNVSRAARGTNSLMVIEVDNLISARALREIAELKNVTKFISLEPIGGLS